MRAILRQIRANLRSRKLHTTLIFLTLAASALLLAMALSAYFAGYHVYDRLLARDHGAHIWLQAHANQVDAADLQAAVNAQPEVVEATAPLPTFNLTLLAPNDHKDGVLAREMTPRAIAPPLLVDGRPPRADAHEIILDRNLARALDVSVGDEVKLWLGDDISPFAVTGLFVTSEFCAYPFCRPARVYLSPNALGAAFPHAQPDSLDIGLRLRHPQQAKETLRALQAALPDGSVDSYTWQEIRGYVGFEMRLQSVFMLAFALMAGLVGGFLIANAVAGAIRAQTRQIGLLRAIGFSNGQLAWLYLGEYLLLGLVASLLGLITGAFLGQRLLAGLAQRYAAGALWPPPGVLLATLALALTLTALSAAWPLRRIAALNTVTAIRQGAEPPRHRQVRLLRLRPALAQGFASLLATPGRTLFTTLGLAVGALAITVALSLGATVQAFADDPAGMGLLPAADVSLQVNEGQQPDALRTAIAASADVQSYACQASLSVHVVGEDKALYPRAVCGDMDLYANMLLEGRMPRSDDEAAAAYTIARQHNWRPGDEVTLVREGSTRVFRIVGIYRDMNNLGQMFILPAQAFTDITPGLFYLRLRPGVDAAAFVDEIESQFGDSVSGSVVATALKDDGDVDSIDVGSMLKNTVLALSALLGIITAFGVMSSLSMSVYEERRTVGILKAIGMTPGQVAAAVISAAMAMAVVGYLVGAPAGVAAARALLGVLSKFVGLGPIAMPTPALELALLLPGLLAVAALGAYLPAHRAARQPVVAALRDE